MFDIDLDKGFRPGAFEVAGIYYFMPTVGIEAEFVDEGKQPNGIKNVNKPVNFDMVLKSPTLYGFTASIKGGLTSSYLSHNGSGNSYQNHTGFTGGNGGVALSYKLNDHWSLNEQLVLMSYQQSDSRPFETFLSASVGIKYSFGSIK